MNKVFKFTAIKVVYSTSAAIMSLILSMLLHRGCVIGVKCPQTESTIFFVLFVTAVLYLLALVVAWILSRSHRKT